MRNLVLVLGDQLDPNSSALDDFDARNDLVWMAELPEESKHVWSGKSRIVFFLSAMRHFAADLAELTYPLHYLELGKHQHRSFAEALHAEITAVRPQRLVVAEPGEYRVLVQLQRVAERAGLPLEIRPDRHFLMSLEGFNQWAEGRKHLRLEHFYRHMRQHTGVLMDVRKPVGGSWNFDKENRKSFGKKGPGVIPPPLSFPPDVLTQAVAADVEKYFPNHPGSIAHFDWPVTPDDAALALSDFITHRLPDFGPFQDACWTAEPYLYHSCLSAAMNLKLISPQTVVEAAVTAFESGKAPLASVEGFIRQIIGWREFIRGIYWNFMPDYLEKNSLGAHLPLPAFYWTGETDMRCLSETIRQTLDHGYAHHIQRLMITGLYALLLGVEPRQVHEWYLAVYVDAVEWVELPNVLGMSQFADGGLMSSKPYVASGKYIQRMSNYCGQCRFDPQKSTGETACPFTTLYWDFLIRHEQRFKNHPRAGMQWRNLSRLSSEKRSLIENEAGKLKSSKKIENENAR
jgi:deoxyribodipyrimidine photolyase-related protein